MSRRSGEVPRAFGVSGAARAPEPDGQYHCQPVRLQEADTGGRHPAQHGGLRPRIEPDAAHVEHKERDRTEETEDDGVDLQDLLPRSGVHASPPMSHWLTAREISCPRLESEPGRT